MLRFACLAALVLVMVLLKYGLGQIENVLRPLGWEGAGVYALICGLGVLCLYLIAVLIDRAERHSPRIQEAEPLGSQSVETPPRLGSDGSAYRRER
ncbi:hypothetical protein CI41S_40130 [Bradyrhizobium ivorense]|nr:hypothetical protein CI41S_40130 [Bradyrhizobium ivorense]